MKKENKVPLALQLKACNLQYLNQLASQNKLSASDMLNLILSQLRDKELHQLLSRS